MELKNVEILRIGELKTFTNSDFKCVEFIVKTDDYVTDPENELSVLLDGKDNMLKVLAGPSEVVFKLIDECYTARESGEIIAIKTATEIIYFR